MDTKDNSAQVPPSPAVTREEPKAIYAKHRAAIRKAIDGPLKALAEVPQFMNWKLEPGKDGKMEKIPVDRWGWPVNAHDPANWMGLEEALFYGDASGLGVAFVFTKTDRFQFIDVDHCIVEGVLSAFACEILALFPFAYVEVSQSGTGIHIFAAYTDAAPPHKCKYIGPDKTQILEVYTELRFVAMTGTDARGDSGKDCTVGLHRVIDRYLKRAEGETKHISGDIPQRWNDRILLGRDPNWRGPEDDDELLEKMRKSTSRFAAFGEKASFRDLYEANEEKLSRAYPPIGAGEPYDRNKADMAIACHLAFWTGKDVERIKRIMLQSALRRENREKWDRVDYLPRTILNACDGQAAVLGRKQEAATPAGTGDDGLMSVTTPKIVEQLDAASQAADLGWGIVSIADIYINPPKPQLFFIDGWLPANVLTFFAGHGGTGKSMLALHAAVCLATGLPFMGKTTIKCRVLFFSAEDSSETIRRRLIKICNGMKISPSILAETLEIIDATKNPYLFSENVNKKAETTNEYSALQNLVKTNNSDMIILDNASDIFDANENNRAQVRSFVRALVQLGEESHTTVLLLAHVDKLTAKGEGSSESYSGVTAWHNSARSRWYLAGDGRIVILQHKKSNFGPLSPEINMGWSSEGLLIPLSNNDPLVQGEDILITMLMLIKRYYDKGVYISPASNSGSNAYNTLKSDAEFPKSINRQKQLTPLLDRATNEGRLCVEKYKKEDGNTQRRYKVNESTQDNQT